MPRRRALALLLALLLAQLCICRKSRAAASAVPQLGRLGAGIIAAALADAPPEGRIAVALVPVATRVVEQAQNEEHHQREGDAHESRGLLLVLGHERAPELIVVAVIVVDVVAVSSREEKVRLWTGKGDEYCRYRGHCVVGLWVEVLV